MTRLLILLWLVGLCMVGWFPVTRGRTQPSLIRGRHKRQTAVRTPQFALPSRPLAARVPTSEQIQAFLSSHPEAQVTLAQAKRNNSVARVTAGCPCQQTQCAAVTRTIPAFLEPPVFGDTCAVIEPAGGIVYTECTEDTIFIDCSEVQTCGCEGGVCTDVDFIDVSVMAVCLRTPPLGFEPLSFTVPLPNGCCCV